MLLVPLLELALPVLVDLGGRPLVLVLCVPSMPMLLLVPPTSQTVLTSVKFLPVLLLLTG